MLLMRRRVLVLPVLAAVIALLCAYKATRTYDRRAGGPAAARARRPVRSFELYDQKSRLVKFERYVGRHRIIVVFYDGRAGADTDANVRRLTQEFDRLNADGVVVVGISRALPQENRRAAARMGGIPFLLLSDITGDVHRLWNRPLNSQPGLYWVDRGGRVAWSAAGPQPTADIETVLRAVNDSR